MLVLVALAPPTVVAVIVAFEEREDARDHAESDVLDAARLAASDTDVGVDATARLLTKAARDLSERPAVRHCKRLLARVPEATDWYSSSLVGLDEPALRRVGWRELVHSADRRYVAAHLVEALAGNDPLREFDARLLPPDGHHVPARLRVELVRGDHGHESRFIMEAWATT
jgi:hypothetical protein